MAGWHPLQIGERVVDVPVVLAPMAGYTDSAFRSLCRRFHCGLSLTEVVNAAGIVYGSRATLHLLETSPGERPVGAHIYGSDPAVMGAAAAIIASLNRFDFIDINCGCPVRKIVAKGAGVALMADPPRVARIVEAVRQASCLPVTVKTRIGLTEDRLNVSDVARAAEDGGASVIFLHARPASSRHGGPARWDILARVKRERGIPVVGNGGIECARDVERMLAETGVDGVMIGRAAVGNPWIFEEVRAMLRGEACAPHLPAEHRRVILEHLDALVALKLKDRANRRAGGQSSERAAAMHFRGHLFKYLAGWPGWGEVRRGLSELRSVEDIVRAVDSIIAP